MKRKKLSFTSRYVLAFGLLMLFANVLLSIVILYRSTATIRSLINRNMLDVVQSAAGLMDGDTLAALTEEDVDGPIFCDIEDKLLAFQNHENVQFIYAVKQADENTYVFTVDPDPVDPGAFGEEIVVTDALIEAGKGTAAVDSAREADRWGNYYSAYCPVFDSAGNVAGIIGVDFDADWYEASIRRYAGTILGITCISVCISAALVFLITHNVRKRFRVLDSELSTLSSGMDELVASAGGSKERPDSDDTQDTADEIEKLSVKIHLLQSDLSVYEKLRKDQYYNDTVTGIPNLNFLRQVADDRIKLMWNRNDNPVLFYFDIRSMVSYNTEYGYARGDDLLRLTAKTIQSAFPDALVARGKADHFIVVDTYHDDIEKTVSEINAVIRKEAYGRPVGIQCAVVPMTPEMTLSDAAQRARSTLKKIGDDLNINCRFYSYEEDRETQLNQYIVQNFEEALQKGWIRVFYQPILRAATQKISSLEALARWADPVYGIISPAQFVPVLSRYHLLHMLDLYMLEEVCREFGVRKETGLPLIPVSVNFSAQDFDYTDVPERIQEAVKRYDLTPDDIIVEITEQDIAEGTEKFKASLKQIRAAGFRLWIDDFGSGYSSLNVFSQYDIDRIKFDMELVRHMDDNHGANRRVLYAMVKVCQELGVSTLAEGVETPEQYDFLREINCDLVQGYYFFKPDPVEVSIENYQHRSADIPCEAEEDR